MTSLGLVQMTRKRMGTGLLEVWANGVKPAPAAASSPTTSRWNTAGPTRSPRNTTSPGPKPARRPYRAQGAARSGRPGNRRAVRGGRGPPGAHRGGTPRQGRGHPCRAGEHRRRRPRRPPARRGHDGRGRRRNAPGRVDRRGICLDGGGTGRPAAVLTFGGEQVALPFVEHADASTAPALTLDLLTEAFAHLGDAEAEPQAAAPRFRPQTGSAGARGPDRGRRPARTRVRAGTRPGAGASPRPKPRQGGTSAPRRVRRNRSASRAQGAANATSVEQRHGTPVVRRRFGARAKAPAARVGRQARGQPADHPWRRRPGVGALTQQPFTRSRGCGPVRRNNASGCAPHPRFAKRTARLGD